MPSRISRKRKSFGRKRRYGAGGGKRIRSAFRRRPAYRKGRRSVRTSRRGKGLRNTRPTPHSIAKDGLITKLVDFEQCAIQANAGTYGVQVFDCTPRVAALQSIFGAAFAFNGTAATYVAVPTGANGVYSTNAKVAVEASRKDEFVNGSNEKNNVTLYRIQARDHITFAQIGGTGLASLADINTFVKGLLNQTTVKQSSGTVNVSYINTIGVTPYDSPAFCSQFKIVKRSQFSLRPNGIKRKSYKCRARLYTGLDINTYGILKGAYLDLWYTKGGLGRYTTAATVNASAVTTVPTEIIAMTRWDYCFVPEQRTNVAVDKYILTQVPNDPNANAAVGANDLLARAVVSNTLVTGNSAVMV
jgi:hypothetical protein